MGVHSFSLLRFRLRGGRLSEVHQGWLTGMRAEAEFIMPMMG